VLRSTPCSDRVRERMLGGKQLPKEMGDKMPTMKQTAENLKHSVEHMLHGFKRSTKAPGRCAQGHSVAAGADTCLQGHPRS
jgi:hypothetical protein